MHSHVEARGVRDLQEHDVGVFKQDPVNVGVGNLGVVGSGIGVASPRGSRIFCGGLGAGLPTAAQETNQQHQVPAISRRLHRPSALHGPRIAQSTIVRARTSYPSLRVKSQSTATSFKSDVARACCPLSRERPAPAKRGQDAHAPVDARATKSVFPKTQWFERNAAGLAAPVPAGSQRCASRYDTLNGPARAAKVWVILLLGGAIQKLSGEAIYGPEEFHQELTRGERCFRVLFFVQSSDISGRRAQTRFSSGRDILPQEMAPTRLNSSM